jgi:acetolactate decarboxylase
MKKNVLFLLAGLLLLSASLNSQDKGLFQYSTITSLLEGVYDGNLTLAEFQKHGNFGIGTFNNLDGEMVVLNDTVYQVPVDGIPRTVPSETKIPFGNILYFNANSDFDFTDTVSLADFQKYLETKLISDNLVYAVRADGVFKVVKVRSVPAQKKPYPRLVEAAKKQAVFEYKNIKGTLLGFKVPKYMDGVNVSGCHFHFISDDRKHGGHLLDCTTGNIKVRVQDVYDVKITLPDTDDFLNKKNIQRNEHEIKKIEN